MSSVKPLEWVEDKRVFRWLDTRELPWREVYHETKDYRRVADAIKRMEIRGAPAIGVAAAFGFALAVLYSGAGSPEELDRIVEEAYRILSGTRPTAYNLFWALNRMKEKYLVLRNKHSDVLKIGEELLNEAKSILKEDIEINKRIGANGAKLINDGDTILTHCNAGALATAGYGTAEGVIRAAVKQGKRIKVIATETRPLLQGARLTVWELVKEKIPVTLITDNMVGYVISKGLVDKVVVGADRITSDGYVANKIGTYTIAVLASHHRVPFYVAAPVSTIDYSLIGPSIPIEHRDPDEVRTILGKILITVPDVDVLNPAFDITPPELVTAIITEEGIATYPYSVSLKKFRRQNS